MASVNTNCKFCDPRYMRFITGLRHNKKRIVRICWLYQADRVVFQTAGLPVVMATRVFGQEL